MAVVNNGYDLLLLAEYLQGDTEHGNLTSLTRLSKFNYATKTWSELGAEIAHMFDTNIAPIQGRVCSNTR